MRAGRPGHALVALEVPEREIAAGRADADRQPGCVIEASGCGRLPARGPAEPAVRLAELNAKGAGRSLGGVDRFDGAGASIRTVLARAGIDCIADLWSRY